MKRREFLAKSSILTFAPIVSKFNDSIALAGVRVPGLQLFTLFGQIDKDVKGTLKKVADLGVKEIESAFSFLPGFYGMSAKEFDETIQSFGMKWVSHHVLGAPLKPSVTKNAGITNFPKINNLRDNAEEAVASLAGTSVKYIVCANTPIETKKEVEESVEVLKKSAVFAKKAGLTLCFHNHDAEFKEVEGARPFDVFANELSTDELKFEIDLGWAFKAGVDIPGLFKKHAGRFPLCHLKDFSVDFKEMLPLGTGILNYKQVLAAANEGGLKHFFIEHDFPKDAFMSIETGVKSFNLM
ncbi:MAG: hypothetical protein RI995_2073 [Bacteroidota bacterium]